MRSSNGHSYELVPDSDGWKRVLARGCGGTQDYWGEFDCSHQYNWTCDDCPIVIEKYKQEQNKEAA